MRKGVRRGRDGGGVVVVVVGGSLEVVSPLHFPAPSVPGCESWKPRLCQTPPTRSEDPDTNSEDSRHLFQTTARREPPRPLTTNHTASDDVVNLLLERILPSGALESGRCQPAGWREGEPEQTWRLESALA